VTFCSSSRKQESSAFEFILKISEMKQSEELVLYLPLLLWFSASSEPV
jgi:hypothetical protein